MMQENNPLVSVIVPAYGVENYLPACIESIRSQTYQNLEIILVDDGSPDRCGEICDEAAEQDCRIKVIHQTNKGLSSARNAGIEKANGDWIGFVDGDDWIEPEMYQDLLEATATYKADIATCGYLREYQSFFEIENRPELTVLHGQEEIAKAFFRGHSVGIAVWRRLYHRSFFENGLRFVEGRNFEDTPFTVEVLLRVNTMVCLKQCYYHWRARKSSIVHTLSLQNAVDFWHSAADQYELLEKELPEYHRELLSKCCKAMVRTWRVMATAGKEERSSVAPIINEIRLFAKKHRREILLGKYSLKDKFIVCMVFFGGRWSCSATKTAWEIYRVLNGRKRKEKELFP